MTRRKEMGNPQFLIDEAGLLLFITNLNVYVLSSLLEKCFYSSK
jgi:hypothetical protein